MATNIKLENNTYEIIRNRLDKQADDLRQRMQQLNTARKEVFGATTTSLLANDRIHTDNYCIARDIAAVGQYCIFGYNVHVGLRSGIALNDVFRVYAFEGQGFQSADLGLLQDDKFSVDFLNLYRYYKDAYFARFAQRGRYLYMVFHLNRKTTDFKAFKWLMTDEGLQYVDNRSDHEVGFPRQYEFKWKLAGRDEQRNGQHPHISILDRVFVETVGGDLTIKVEDNTDDGMGIYREPVEHKDQTLDDAEYAFADLGNLIALRIKPYQEEDRYFVFNEKMQSVERIDSLSTSGVLLPDNQGLVFPDGYYLQTGEYKLFDRRSEGLVFKKRIASPNGEDYFFVFFEEKSGLYLLMHYNVISQEVATPILCNGFSLFPDGELCYFKAETEPTKHHVIQIWQTPFVAGETVPSEHTDSYLYKVGNKDLVQAMAECQEILTLTGKEDSYANLYDDLVKRCTDVLDNYYWIKEGETFRLDEALAAIRQTAHTAIEEYEKKVQTQRKTTAEMDRVGEDARLLLDRIRRATFDSIDLFVENLSDLRQLRGQVVGLKDLPYVDDTLISSLEEKAQKANEQLSEDCVHFLLGEKALVPYEQKITAEAKKIEQLETAKAATKLDEGFDQLSTELEMLIEIVSNLKIDDATHTTRIIDTISGLFTQLNQHKAALRQKTNTFRNAESAAEFQAQLSLLEQSIINYLDLTDTPPKCDEYLTKLMVQIEELESRFAEIESFVATLTEKRESVLAAFDHRKQQLVEAHNNRTATLAKAADRILDGLQKRAAALKEETEINTFFTADLMVEKTRNVVAQLTELKDNNKAQAIQTRLKSLKEEAVRALRDRKDLFLDGDQVIKLGNHQFAVNTQPLELTVVNDKEDLLFHLTGTNFYEAIQNEELTAMQSVWQQSLIAENDDVYRAEYLAWQLLRQARKEKLLPHSTQLSAWVKKEAGVRYQEGYAKGVHDEDASKILSGLLEISESAGLLTYTPSVRACGKLWWTKFISESHQELFSRQLESAGQILNVFPNTHEFDYLISDLRTELQKFIQATNLFPEFMADKAAEYLFRELTESFNFVCSQEAAALYEAFLQHLKKKKALTKFKQSIGSLEERERERYLLIRKWVHAFLEEYNTPEWQACQEEVAALLMADDFQKGNVLQSKTNKTIANLRGEHAVIEAGNYLLNLHAFTAKMEEYMAVTVPAFQAFAKQKKAIVSDFRNNIHLEDFRPKVMSSFVRNRLIDEVYLPIIGDNLAKQIGSTGEQTRTDRMGMLLLISPPGYGKTTLMEYIANRLGLIFMKINGPAIGHQVTSLAPEDAPSLAAAKELEKLNMAFEMGDNVMIYVDDIQHCHPEFLQKFISLCDAQRKIEGVYKGKAKTYDFKGRKVCVVMAGNPYTESGSKFQIPDMLANRADIYNLGDIIGDTAAAFRQSFIENALTSNSTLSRLAAKSMKDVYTLLTSVEQGQHEGLVYESKHSAKELEEYRTVMEKLLSIRDVILKVNEAYIQSAAMSDDYRKEPPFKLQGSYRNMNKLAEKVSAIMNDEELQNLILSHYEGEVQTLTSNAEANHLKLKELLGWLSKDEVERWNEIRETFLQNNSSGGDENAKNMSKLLEQLSSFQGSLEGIREAIDS